MRRIPTKTGKTEQRLPRDLRPRLEQARLKLRALFRAIDQLHLAQELPATLQALMSLDADLAEALWVLDQPAHGFDLQAIGRDTLRSLSMLPAAWDTFLAQLELADRGRLLDRQNLVASQLQPEEAYRQVPGRDPHA